jgi:glutamate/tyrosine decarboxylase-like PLP-dependent enzyme
LNIVCFRYKGGLTDVEALDALNEKILVELQETGFCVMSPFRIDGHFCLRVAISNHRTRREDLTALVDRVIACGRRLEQA